MGDLLRRAQQEFGSRDVSYTPLGVEFTANGPYIWYPGDPADHNVVIRLNSTALTDVPQACYQLAQECIHLLAPTGGSHANYLEEGISIVFARRYINEHFGFSMDQPNPKYSEAAQLVEALLALDPEAVRKVRAVQPSFSQITVANLRDKVPNCSAELAEKVLRTF
jgi:hypothetical protein